MLGVFAEFEREMIVARVNAGLARAKTSGTKSGKPIGRPKLAAKDCEAVRSALVQGCSVREASRNTGLSVGTIAGIRKGLIESGALAA
jgi:DNA invertase Pin-like site-specific DNA recombinase